MKKIALLTSRNLEHYVTDEEAFFEVLREDPYFDPHWCIWDENQDWSKYDGAIVRTTWDYTENLDRFLRVLQEIESRGCRLFNDYQTILWNSNKKYLIELADAEHAVIPTALMSTQPVDELFFKWGCQRLVCKPLVGASAHGIIILDRQWSSKPSLKNAVGNIAPEDYFVQPFIENIEDGELSFHFFNGEFSHAVKKVPKPGDFRVQEEYGSDIQVYVPTESEIQLAAKYLVKDVLYARVDLVLHDDRLYLMELELIEPSLYFRKDSQSSVHLVEALKSRYRLW